MATETMLKTSPINLKIQIPTVIKSPARPAATNLCRRLHTTHHSVKEKMSLAKIFQKEAIGEVQKPEATPTKASLKTMKGTEFLLVLALDPATRGTETTSPEPLGKK